MSLIKKLIKLFKRMEISNKNSNTASETKEQSEKALEGKYIPVYYLGHLIRILPEPGSPYSKHIDLIFSSNTIISDDVYYSLNQSEKIKQIPIPPYEIHGKNSIDKDLGAIGTIEYFLLRKGNYYWDKKEYGLAFSCYAKATSMMIVTDEYWPPEAYDLIVNKYLELGETETARKWERWIEEQLCLPEEKKTDEKKDASGGIPKEVSAKKPKKDIQKKLSYVEKERIIVQRITSADMQQFTQIPYDLNCPIHKYDKSNGHPFAYMDLNSANIKIAKSELSKLNNYIVDVCSGISGWSRKFCIDVDKVAFAEYSPNYGYTKLMCTPYTFTGEISKIPVSLSFMSRLDVMQYQVVGNLDYSADGNIIKANVNIWSRYSYEKPGTGWLFTFYRIDGNLSLEQVKSTINPDKNGMPGIVFRSKHLIEEEKQREALQQEFLWVQNNLPDLCPKSLSGYSRMKNANSTKYQKIESAAAEKGKVLINPRNC